MPPELSRWSLTHGCLENPQLGGTLKVPHNLDRLFQEINVGAPFRRLCPDGLKDGGVLL